MAPLRTVFTIKCNAKFGGPSHHLSFQALKEEFREKKAHQEDLKASMTSGINIQVWHL